MAAIRLEYVLLFLLSVWCVAMAISYGLRRAYEKGRMAAYNSMGGAKLSRRVVERLRQLGDKCDVEAEAEKYQLHPRTIKRILAYETWVEPALATLLDDEHKQCVYCGAVFGRRYASGRWRNDVQWAQKRTCNASCNMYLQWKEGLFNNRRG